ncbi:MAG: pyridoxine 5'-phosphate synthase [Verrucomicrobiales bacterium]|nr:pyridoxine 5'-phosphate synthase [Verrucomicrobiales bacterium]
MSKTLKLGVNIDHVATLRQARYATMLDLPNAEPSLLKAAAECERAGADSITIHLRADRRHIQDRDVFEIRESIATKLNLELGDTPEIVEIALEVKPDFVCVVPESREEITTEGGLDVVAAGEGLKRTVARFQQAGILVSLFVDPDEAQIKAAADAGAEMIELHTGAFANASITGGDDELADLVEAAKLADTLGIQVNAGHGITMANIAKVLQVPHLAELNVGHHLVSQSVFMGLHSVVSDMLTAMEAYNHRA